MTVIYGLRRVGDDEIRYIGHSAKPLELRLRKHKTNAVHGYPPKVSSWIAEAGDVEIVALAECEHADRFKAERETVVQYHARGARLTNSHLVPRS